MLSDETTKENKGKVFGFHRALDTVGAAIGPIVALIYLYYHPGEYFWLFIIAFFPGIIAISFTFFIKEKKKSTTTEKKSPGFFSYLKYWKKSPTLYKKLVIGLLLFTLFNSSDALLLLNLNKTGFSDTKVISFYIFYNLVFALASYPLGVLADKLGMKKILIAGLFLFAIVYFFFGFAVTGWHFLALFLIYGIYAASTEGVSKAWITNISNKNEIATAIGFYNSLASICAMLASAIAGILWFTFSPTVMFMTSGIGVALVVVYLLTIKENLQKQETNT